MRATPSRLYLVSCFQQFSCSSRLSSREPALDERKHVQHGFADALGRHLGTSQTYEIPVVVRFVPQHFTHGRIEPVPSRFTEMNLGSSPVPCAVLSLGDLVHYLHPVPACSLWNALSASAISLPMRCPNTTSSTMNRIYSQ